jgi:hypothetical protein
MPAQFGKVAEPLGHVQVGQTRSPDGEEFTILFDKLIAQVGKGMGTSSIDTRQFSFVLPVEGTWAQGTGDDTPVSLDIRGHAFVDPKTRAVLLVQAGGETQIFQWDDIRKAGEFTQTVEGKIPAGSDYQATLFLLVERDTHHPGSTAVLTLDSLDLKLDD